MKTFQTMDCVFNEIILCNWVWHWDVKAMQKVQRFWFSHRNPNWDWAHPQFASSPMLPGAELMSWGLHGQVTKYGLEFGNRGPGAELWRFSLFGIESRLSLRERFGLATSSPGWSTASNYSHQLCRRERKNIPGKSISGNPGTGWKTNLDFPSCSLKTARWDTTSPRIRSSQFGTCSTTPIYIYTHPPKLLRHI